MVHEQLTKSNKQNVVLFYIKNMIKFDAHNFFLIASTNFWWWLNLETLTWVKDQTLPGSQIFLFF
jgi:hypothetical protein